MSSPTTGGMGSSGSIPDYVKMFGQVFSEEGFAKLPNRKPWDHAIELAPGAQPKGCCKGDYRVGSGSKSEVKYMTGSRDLTPDS